jgi:nitroreductase
MSQKVFVPVEKQSQVSSEIIREIRDRWSPYNFDSRPVPKELVEQCLIAASWAASSYNEQPWSFIVAHREQAAEFKRMLACLLDANQVWAQHASVLLLTVSQETFSRNGQPNRVHQHDLGQAAAHFSLQATALGLAVHQMAGIHLGKIRTEFGIPDGYSPQTAIAVGYPAQEKVAGREELVARDAAPRTRKSLPEFVFYGSWGKPARST